MKYYDCGLEERCYSRECVDKILYKIYVVGYSIVDC